MKVLVVGNDRYANWIDEVTLVETIEEAQIVLFTGGEDVSPSIYDEEAHETTFSSIHRDKIDIHIFKKAIAQGKLILGICRGSQLSTVMAGGKLVQHVTNHGIYGTHGVATDDGIFEATSTHHQMMYPFGLNKENYEILGFAAPKRSTVYFKNKNEEYPEIKREPEVVWYNKIKALACQPHPENMNKNSDFVIWLNKLIKKYE